MNKSPLPAALARRFLERHSALELGNGKKADDAALHFFCGAAVALGEAGDLNASHHVGRVAVMMIAVRGMFAVRELAAEPVVDPVVDPVGEG